MSWPIDIERGVTILGMCMRVTVCMGVRKWFRMEKPMWVWVVRMGMMVRVVVMMVRRRRRKSCLWRWRMLKVWVLRMV